jgi:hypothetical protein
MWSFDGGVNRTANGRRGGAVGEDIGMSSIQDSAGHNVLVGRSTSKTMLPKYLVPFSRRQPILSSSIHSHLGNSIQHSTCLVSLAGSKDAKIAALAAHDREIIKRMIYLNANPGILSNLERSEFIN